MERRGLGIQPGGALHPGHPVPLKLGVAVLQAVGDRPGDGLAHPLQDRDESLGRHGVDGLGIREIVAHGRQLAGAHPQLAGGQLEPADLRIVLRRVVGGVPLESEDAVQFLVQDVAPSFAIILRAEVGLLDVGRLGVAEQRMFERAVSLDDAMPSRDRDGDGLVASRLLQLEHAVDRGLRESRRSLSGAWTPDRRIGGEPGCGRIRYPSPEPSPRRCQ